MTKNAFAFSHLPAHLAEISRPFGELAKWMLEKLPASAERSAALRHLLEAKDAAVRSFGDIAIPQRVEEFEG
jgi:hypothetical protein